MSKAASDVSVTFRWSRAVSTETHDVDLGFRRGYHLVSSREMGAAMRAELLACATCTIAGLRESCWYEYAMGQHHEVVVVLRTVPSGGQAEVAFLTAKGMGQRDRIYAGRYHGEFRCLTTDLVRLLTVTHEEVVRYAIERVGASLIPPTVRREYPGLFLDVPDRFAKPDEFGAKTAAERVKTTLAKFLASERTSE